MPGRNGTGPMGQGSMTGWGRGPCGPPCRCSGVSGTAPIAAARGGADLRAVARLLLLSPPAVPRSVPRSLP